MIKIRVRYLCEVKTAIVIKISKIIHFFIVTLNIKRVNNLRTVWIRPKETYIKKALEKSRVCFIRKEKIVEFPDTTSQIPLFLGVFATL